MNILFIGEINSGSRGLQRLNSLLELGHKVTTVNLGPIALPYLKLKLLNLTYKLGYPYDVLKVNQQVIDFASNNKYDYVWVDKALVLKPSTLKKVMRLQPEVKILMYTEDNLFLKHNQSKYFLSCVKYFDLFVTTKSENLESTEPIRKDIRKIFFVNNSYDENIHKPSLKEWPKRFRNEVLFIGSYEPIRAASIAHIAEGGVPVTIWGDGWKSFSHASHKNIKLHGKGLRGEDYADEVFNSRISLCFLRKANHDLQTARSVEIPACGGFMLAEDTDEHRALFENDKEAVYFTSNEDLLGKVIKYLNNEEKRLDISKRARERCLDSEYSHKDMINLIINELEQ
ncbi:MAG: hypothetical protein BM556_08970 [Bacteriovorax sp. MedPE-SWde]|nr:MAG: hypothetical protein BM556_08970 [Bacteriovorax sp. MedPE-SWde]